MFHLMGYNHPLHQAIPPATQLSTTADTLAHLHTPPGYSNTDAVDTSEVNTLDISDTSLLLSSPYCVILLKVEELEFSPGAQHHQHQFLHVTPVELELEKTPL